MASKTFGVKWKVVSKCWREKMCAVSVRGDEHFFPKVWCSNEGGDHK
ncbi:MAG: hypothetical protein WAM26_08485 [Nitrososphaeraceae archaeon]